MRRKKGTARRRASGDAGELTVEATGETVGEAKWAALRELELRHPGLDKSAVRFEVVSEGERGLLGVGYAPARVVATAPGGRDRAVPIDESDVRRATCAACSCTDRRARSASTRASTCARTTTAIDGRPAPAPTSGS